MEKRFTIALVLSLLVLFLWQAFFMERPTRKPPDEAAEEATTRPGERGGAAPGEPEEGREPEPGRERLVDPDAVRRVTLRNESHALTFSSHGAVLEKAELLHYQPRAQVDEPLQLLVPSEQNLCALRIEDLEHPELALGRTLWDMETSAGGRSVTFSRTFKREVKGSEVAYAFKKTFILPEGDAPYVEIRLDFEYPGPDPTRQLRTDFALLVTGGVFQELGGEVMSPPRSAVHPFEDDLELFNESEVAQKVEGGPDLRTFLDEGREAGIKRRLGAGHRFVADLSNYHGAFLLLQEFPADVTALVNRVPPRDRHDHGSKAPRTGTVVSFPARVNQGSSVTWKGLLYLGPVETGRIAATLEGAVGSAETEALGKVYEDQLGWARPIGKAVLAALRGLHGVVGNWGWAIVLLTLCVRVLLFPINRKSQAAMLRTQEAHARVKPKLDALKEKYKNDSKKFYEEQMKLFKKEDVPLFPLGGCLPIFLQIPVFFGLFSALRASIDLRQAPWLWVADLSQPDHLHHFAEPVWNPLSLCGACCGMPAPPITGFHLLPVLMTVAWVLNSYFMPRPESANPQYDQQRKMMMFMPVLFGLFMYSYAAGLSLYWLTSSIVGIVESRLIKKLWPVKKPEPAKETRSAARG